MLKGYYKLYKSIGGIHMKVDKDTTSERTQKMPESSLDGPMNEKVKEQLALKPGEKKVSKEDQK